MFAPSASEDHMRAVPSSRGAPRQLLATAHTHEVGDGSGYFTVTLNFQMMSLPIPPKISTWKVSLPMKSSFDV